MTVLLCVSMSVSVVVGPGLVVGVGVECVGESRNGNGL